MLVAVMLKLKSVLSKLKFSLNSNGLSEGVLASNARSKRTSSYGLDSLSGVEGAVAPGARSARALARAAAMATFLGSTAWLALAVLAVVPVAWTASSTQADPSTALPACTAAAGAGRARTAVAVRLAASRWRCWA